MQEKTRYRRRQYLVSTKFQLKYAGLILLLVFMTALLCSYVIYYTMMMTMGDKLANVYPQGRLLGIVNAVNFRIMVSIILIAPLIVIIGIFASHKIAGPIFRIERYLGAMAEGEYSTPLTLRRNDELMSLASSVNKVVDSVKVCVKDERERLSQMYSSLEELKKVSVSKPLNHASLDKAIDKLAGEVAALSKSLEKYKV